MARGTPYSASAVGQAAFDAGLRAYMLRIFNYMGIGLAITGAVALFFGNAMLNDMQLAQTLFGSPLRWLIMLSPLAFVLVLSFGINKLSASTATALFFAFAAVMGLSMSSIFLVYTGTSIARVFFITAATFGGASLWGYTTKRDLTGMGSFLMMGLIGLVIASVVNMFLGSTGLQFALSVISVIIFTGLTAYDSQNLKEQYSESYGRETMGKLAIMGALSLYLNFINIFTALMQLMGTRRD